MQTDEIVQDVVGFSNKPSLLEPTAQGSEESFTRTLITIAKQVASRRSSNVQHDLKLPE